MSSSKKKAVKAKAGARTGAKATSKASVAPKIKTKLRAKKSATSEIKSKSGTENSRLGHHSFGHHSKRAPEPVGPYPHARRVGDFIFVSGMGPRRPGAKDIPGVFQNALGEVVSYDIELQTRSTIENIKMVLEDMGSSLNDVVDVSVFLTAMKQDFQRFNKVYGEYFAKIGPTRTTVEVLSLPTPIAVELKVIAHRKK